MQIGQVAGAGACIVEAAKPPTLGNKTTGQQLWKQPHRAPWPPFASTSMHARLTISQSLALWAAHLMQAAPDFQPKLTRSAAAYPFCSSSHADAPDIQPKLTLLAAHLMQTSPDIQPKLNLLATNLMQTRLTFSQSLPFWQLTSCRRA